MILIVVKRGVSFLSQFFHFPIFRIKKRPTIVTWWGA